MKFTSESKISSNDEKINKSNNNEDEKKSSINNYNYKKTFIPMNESRIKRLYNIFTLEGKIGHIKDEKQINVDGNNNNNIDANNIRLSKNEVRHGFEQLNISEHFNEVIIDSLVSELFSVVDKDGDGMIDYKDFKHFIRISEQQLWTLFKDIDVDNNGQIDREELRKALASRGILSPDATSATSSHFNDFFRLLDRNNDGLISFDEWRDSLLFLPVTPHSLQATFQRFVDSTNLSSEGDVVLSDDTLQGIGYFIAGGLAGVISRTATAPFDRVKVFLIAQTPDSMAKALHLSSLTLSSNKNLNSKLNSQTINTIKNSKPMGILRSISTFFLDRPIFNAMRVIWRQGGFFGFYVGNGLNILKVVPESAIKFGTFEATKRAMAAILFGTSYAPCPPPFASSSSSSSNTSNTSNDSIINTSNSSYKPNDDLGDDEKVSANLGPADLPRWATFIAGGIAGAVSQFAVYPVDTLKFRVQCETSTEKGSKHLIKRVAKSMWEKGGLKLYYRGLFVGVSGIFPFAALDLGIFEALKRAYLVAQANKLGIDTSEVVMSNLAVLSMGAFSGSVGATAVYPINLLRTRLQAQGTHGHPYTYNGFFDVLQKTLSREGPRGLFRGLAPNIAKVAPSVSISYLVYENAKRMMQLE